MPIREEVVAGKQFRIECDNMRDTSVKKHTIGPEKTYSEATKAAHDAGWVCFGYAWICKKCQDGAKFAVENPWQPEKSRGPIREDQGP